MDKKNNSKDDLFKNAVKTLCKHENISTRKIRFTTFENFITIDIKNNSKDGLDIECFKIINIIFNLIGSTRTQFKQTLFTIPNSQQIDKIQITFKIEEYNNLSKIFIQ